MRRMVRAVLALAIVASTVSGTAAAGPAGAASGACDPATATPARGFADVAASSFAAADIACIAASGITTGTSSTTYDPGGLVTREQMASFLARLWRAVGETCGRAGHGFADVAASSFAAADIACIAASGITTGTSSTTYDPGGYVTREQAASFVARLWRAAVSAGCRHHPTVRTPPNEAATMFDFAAVTPLVQAFVDRNGLNGAGLIVVHRDHCVIHHEHWGAFDEDRVSPVASSSKMISAGVLLHLADTGLLDLDAPVADVVGWGSANPAVTPAHLVSNSSGLIGLSFGLPDPYFCQFMQADTLQRCAEAIFTTPDDDADVVPPDTEFRYGGAQWQVAGAVAEAASGRSWRELVDEIYVTPCGVDSLVYDNPFDDVGPGRSTAPGGAGGGAPVDGTANPNIEGGASIDTGDYGALLLMHLRDGRCGGRRVLSPDAILRAHGDRVGEVYGGDADGPDTGYGMGWWVDRTSGRLTAPGAYGTFAWLDIADGYGAYLALESDSATGARLADQLFAVIDAAVTGSG